MYFLNHQCNRLYIAIGMQSLTEVLLPADHVNDISNKNISSRSAVMEAYPRHGQQNLANSELD